MPSDTLLVLCTCPDQATADRIAVTLVERRLCACVNLIPAVTSVYLWQGKRESAQEILMLVKTGASRYPALEQAVLSMHPYELPEIIAITVDKGLPGYLNWVEQCTTTSP